MVRVRSRRRSRSTRRPRARVRRSPMRGSRKRRPIRRKKPRKSGRLRSRRTKMQGGMLAKALAPPVEQDPLQALLQKQARLQADLASKVLAHDRATTDLQEAQAELQARGLPPAGETVTRDEPFAGSQLQPRPPPRKGGVPFPTGGAEFARHRRAAARQAKAAAEQAVAVNQAELTALRAAQESWERANRPVPQVLAPGMRQGEKPMSSATIADQLIRQALPALDSQIITALGNRAEGGEGAVKASDEFQGLPEHDRKLVLSTFRKYLF